MDGQMVKLAVIAKSEFPDLVRQKGEDYFRQGRAKLTQCAPPLAQFSVEGTEPYEVSIRYAADANEFEMTCTCGEFDQGSDCKHIWASVLELDAKNLYVELVGEAAKAVQITDSSEESIWRHHFLQTQRKMENDRRTSLRQSASSNTQVNLSSQKKRMGFYAVDTLGSLESKQITIYLFYRESLKDGEWGALRPAELSHSLIELYEDGREREALWEMLGKTESRPKNYAGYYAPKIDIVRLTAGHAEPILRMLSEVGRLCAMNEQNRFRYGAFGKPDIQKFGYDQKIWNFRARFRKLDQKYSLEGELASQPSDQTPDQISSQLTDQGADQPMGFQQDGQEFKRLDEVKGVVDHFAFFNESMARVDLQQFPTWFEVLRKRHLEIPEAEVNEFLEFYLNDPAAPPIDLPAELEFQEIFGVSPQVRLVFQDDKDSRRLVARLQFMYGEKAVDYGTGESVYDIRTREKILRDLELERNCHAELRMMEPEPSDDPSLSGFFRSEQFIPVVDKAMNLGWEVVVRNMQVRRGGEFKLNVTSGVDWFDIKADFDFDGQKVSLPTLLQALRLGQRFVSLGNGKTGLLPEEWLNKFSSFAGIGKEMTDGVRLNRIQALFLSAGLKGNSQLEGDQRFGSFQKILGELQSMKPLKSDQGFKGELRDYQEKGLAWLSILSKHDIGGVLADDMGLGKTIQILALLSKIKSEAKKDTKNKSHKKNLSKSENGDSENNNIGFLPSLVVAPKSLVFNWQNEAEKFASHLKVLNYTGVGRHRLTDEIGNYDLVLTTYQTLRSDIEKFQKIQFDHFILDEAQNVKNSQSQIAMACRLVSSKRKFALTGTPIENSLLDLFSILSIVAPGLITTAQASRWAKQGDPLVMANLAKALSPFILRRTKEQVLKDLPEKSEQVLYCELSAPEKKRYDELKAFYWNSLSGKIEENGLAKSKIEVLEALLRLRQAACHQGLLDKNIKTHVSSKFELVLEQMKSIILDGHKVLVFSQFTSLLELFSRELDHLRIKYEYLDGKTRDRAERVGNFQENKKISVFLLSLKAGGVGLNLTAADYVFILDPWWNPAAESQAIDRTHRIGQTKKVFAYKVIAKDTVEEKILELQKKKKKIAEAIISNDASLMKKMNMEDLRELFS
jgi:SNF2 family DNA or RNA helicase